MYRKFYGLEFLVTPVVLTPYLLTERVTRRAMERLKDGQIFCDAGTGSGNIAVTILKHTNTKGIGLDISPAALDVARFNAVANKVANRLELRQSDGLEALTESVDLIVCNPPYWPKDKAASVTTGPQVAITDGFDGLTLIRKVINDAPRVLKAGGTLVLEYIGAEKIAPLFGTQWTVETFREGAIATR